MEFVLALSGAVGVSLGLTVGFILGLSLNRKQNG